MQYQEIQTAVCRGIDYSLETTGSFNRIDCNSDFAEMSEPSHVLQNGFASDGQSAENIPNANQSESESGFDIENCGGSSIHTVAQMEGHFDSAVLGAPCNGMAIPPTTDAEENMGQRSQSAATTSSDGPASHKCFIGDAMLQETNVDIVVTPDYLQYRGTHFVDPIVSFSRSSIEARGRRVYDKEGSFHIHLDVGDVVKLESYWSSRYDTGTLNIHFILKHAAEDNVPHSSTEIQELTFPLVDWHEKREAIESLNDRYRAIWNSLLDSGLENCSVLPAGEVVAPTRSYFPSFDKPFGDVVYPQGDPDAVVLSKRDVDLLLPDTFVNDTLIDFYIKYLMSRQNEEQRNKFYFFNSFFFRKLADMDKDPSGAFDAKAAFQRVRKWTRNVNLLEKDFIFIPVNYNYHWSLLVICYLGEVANYEGVEDGRLQRVPCILHMDSIKGNHLGVKDRIQSYLWEEWKERQQGACDDDLYAKFKNLKFIPLEVPQQPNLFDCGLFLLHYVECFLEDVPENFSIYKITPSTRFLQADWFQPGEASLKRTHIEKLINHLIETRSENPSNGSDMHSSPEQSTAINDGFQNGGDFSLKIGPSDGCHDNMLQTGNGIEMTLLPSSSTTTNLCTSTTELVLKDLFEPLPASESLNDPNWGPLESKSSSFLDFNTHVALPEGKVETGEFLSTDLSEPVFHHMDGGDPETHTFPYSCGDFGSDLVPQPTQENTVSSPVASGELMNTSIEPNNSDGLTLLANNSFSIEPPQQADHSSAPAALTSCGEQELPELNTLHHLDLSISQAEQPHTIASKHSLLGDNGVNDEPVPESDEQRATKKMRMTPAENGGEVEGDTFESREFVM